MQNINNLLNFYLIIFEHSILIFVFIFTIFEIIKLIRNF